MEKTKSTRKLLVQFYINWMEAAASVTGLRCVCVVPTPVAPVKLSDAEATAEAGTSGGGVVSTANPSTTSVQGSGADALCGPQVPHKVLGCRQHLHTHKHMLLEPDKYVTWYSYTKGTVGYRLKFTGGGWSF